MKYRCTILFLLFLVTACGDRTDKVAVEATAEVYDIVIAGGRVIDPESGLDAIRNVGIAGGRIAAVTTDALSGSSQIDATGLVVSPGFINVHSHSWTPIGQEFELRDGVTTALELESGAYPVTDFGTFEPFAIAGKSLINYGASLGHAWIRSRILEDGNAVSGMGERMARAITDGASIDMNTPTFRNPLSAAQREELEIHLLSGLDQGGLGIGMLLDYMSEAVDEAELQVVFDVAGKRKAPVIVHIRRGIAGDTSGLLEMIRFSKSSGAPVHICHVNASAMGGMSEFLRLIREARADGVKITTESFPYNAGSTSNTAAVFNRDWQTIFNISYEDIELAATGERFTEETWNDYRENRPGALIIHHSYKEEWGKIAIADPDVIVAADGAPIVSLEQMVGPYGIGTNARILARYVREQNLLSLNQAIAKMTYLPAKMLQDYSPSMAMKGRITVGADADVTIFDAETIADHAEFGDPYHASTGIAHVIVGGQTVIRDGELLDGVYPGQRVLR